MSLKNDDFPSSAAFDLIAASLENPANKKDALKAKACFAFTLTNAKGDKASWFIDLKEKGIVGTGTGNKPTATLLLSDENFAKLAAGKVKAQKLFMAGDLKIQGNMMATMKLEPVLQKAQNKSKL